MNNGRAVIEDACQLTVAKMVLVMMMVLMGVECSMISCRLTLVMQGKNRGSAIALVCLCQAVCHYGGGSADPGNMRRRVSWGIRWEIDPRYL